MDLGLGVEEKQISRDNKLVRELIDARDMDLTKHIKIKEALEKDEKYAGFPVINLEKKSLNEVQELHEEAMLKLSKNKERLRNFGAAAIHTINYDGNNAANIDRVMSKARREGLDTPKDKAIIRNVTLDHTKVYRNSTDVEKDMGIATEAMYRVDTPDRNMVDNVMRSVVATPVRNIDDYIYEKYSKWNEKADKEREEREKQFEREERARLERETRDEIDFEDYLPNPHLLSR